MGEWEKTMKVYQALYNWMTYESSAQTLSLHRTKEGAEKAVAEHKENDRLEHIDRYKPEKQKLEHPIMKEVGFTDKQIEDYDRDDREDWPKSWQWWGVGEIEVEE